MFYMPKERHDFTGTIIAAKANQTNKKIITQLDNKEKQEQNKYNRLKSEFIRNSNRFIKNRHKNVQARIKKEYI